MAIAWDENILKQPPLLISAATCAATEIASLWLHVCSIHLPARVNHTAGGRREACLCYSILTVGRL